MSKPRHSWSAFRWLAISGLGLVLSAIAFSQTETSKLPQDLNGKGTDPFLSPSGMGAIRARLPDGRWHFQHGPIDLIIGIDGDATAVTVLATRSSSHILPLIKKAKLINLDKSVFWKRDFIDNRGSVKRAVRKRNV